MSLPAFCLLFGDMINEVGTPQSGFASLGEQAKWMLIIGAGGFSFSCSFIVLMNLFSENKSHQIKVEYFRQCLNKDATYYDS
jgi:hypothetical protein